MRGQENMTVGPVSLDMAQRAMCDQNHERSCRIERYGTSPHVMERLHFELALTRGNCPLSMLSQVIEPLFTYFFIHCVIIMSAALQSLDLTNLS